MKRKSFSFCLSLLVALVMTGAIDCGCAFANIVESQKQEATMAGHCEQHGEASAPETKDCCAGCQLQLGALNSQNIDFQLERSKNSFSPTAFSTKNFMQMASKHLLFSSHFQILDARGVSLLGAQEPLYLVLESFLI